MKKKILVIGSLNMDMCIKVDSFPKPGETVLGSSLIYSPGGKGANQAFAVGKLGGDCTMLGCVGDDDFGVTLTNNLKQYLNVEYIKKDKKEPTGTAVIDICNGENSIVVVPGANGKCNKQYLIENDDLFRKTDYVMFQMEIPYEAIFYGIKRAKELGKTVILNPAPAPKNETIPKEVLNCIDYITPNETETSILTGISSEEPIKAGEKLIDMGVKNVIITLGEKGAVLIKENKEHYFANAYKTQAVDTTAAGDCFNGAFVVAIAEGKSEMEALDFANKCSSIAVSRMGAQASIPSREEIQK